MGYAKQQLATREAQLVAATGVLEEVGCLERCENHPDVLLGADDDLVPAYKRGTTMFGRGEFKNVFVSVRDVTDAIKDAYDSNAAEECRACENWKKG